MGTAQQRFNHIAATTAHVSAGKMFGALSIKCSNGKNAAFLWQGCMVFKLDKEAHKEALAIVGAKIASHLYNPEKLMNAWVSIPESHSNQWSYFTQKAVAFVSGKTINH